MREVEIERPASKFAEMRGWFEAKIVSPGKRGMPDRIYHRDGVTMYVEFKRPGEKATAQQRRRHREIQDHGIAVHVIDNLEQAYDLFR